MSPSPETIRVADPHAEPTMSPESPTLTDPTTEPFPSLTDPTLPAVEAGLHIYNQHMGLPPLSTLQREPSLPSYLDPLRSGLSLFTLDKIIQETPNDAHISDVPITFDTCQAKHLLYRVVRLVQEVMNYDALRHPAFTNGTLTKVMSGYFYTFPTCDISSVRTMKPSRLYDEITFLLGQEMIVHFATVPELRSALQQFHFKMPKHRYGCEERLLQSALRGPKWKFSRRARRGPVLVWPPNLHFVTQALLEEAWMWRDEVGLKEVDAVWRIWREVVEMVIKGLVWVHGARVETDTLSTFK
jgi:hypothetical protein